MACVFRADREPETRFPVRLSISPLEAAETAHAGDEEKEIRRNTETVRIGLIFHLDDPSQGSSERLNRFPTCSFKVWMVGYLFNFNLT